MNVKNGVLESSLVFVIFCAILFYAFPSESAEFSLRPSVTLREEYDDNIFLTNDNKVDDFITRAMPSLALKYKTPFWDWTVDYTLDWWHYAKEDISHTSHSLTLLSKVNAIENLLYLDISDTYTSVVLEPRRPSTDVNLDINRTDSNIMTVSPYIQYRLGPATTATAGYRYTNIWYRREGIGRNIHTAFADITRVFSRQFKASLGAEYVADRPQGDEVSNNQKAVYAKASYIISEKTTLDGSLGYRKFDFSNDRDSDGVFYSANLVYRLSETGQVGVGMDSTFTTTPLDGVIESRGEQITIRLGDVFSMDGSLFHRRDRYLEIDRTDTAFGATLGAVYKYNPRTTFRASGRYERDRFMPEDEVRNLYAVVAGVDYKVARNMTVGASYNYTQSSASASVDSYSDNLVAVQLRIDL